MRSISKIRKKFSTNGELCGALDQLLDNTLSQIPPLLLPEDNILHFIKTLHYNKTLSRGQFILSLYQNNNKTVVKKLVWIYSDTPKLRILEDELFEKARLLKSKKGKQLFYKTVKPRHIFSGLTKCGVCGSSYTIIGRNRLGCSGRRERGDCKNKRTVSRFHIEERVLKALNTHLVNPELIAEYIKSYQKKIHALQKEERNNMKAKQKRVRELSKQMDHTIQVIVNGESARSFMDHLIEMEKERDVLIVELELFEKADKIRVHPNLSEKYKRIVYNLHQQINTLDKDDSIRNLIFKEVRNLIEKIVIIPKAKDLPVEIEVHGKLASLLSISTIENINECRVDMVAGAGFEPATFRL